VTKKAAKGGKTAGRKKPPVDSSATFEKLLKQAPNGGRYSLRLYITGTTARSTEAISNIRKLCEEYLAGRYDLEVVDIYQQPTQAADAQIIAAPTLIKDSPKPVKRVVGNLSNRDKVLVALNLKDAASKSIKETSWSEV
jgi:circadian clock protein KaiB